MKRVKCLGTILLIAFCLTACGSSDYGSSYSSEKSAGISSNSAAEDVTDSQYENGGTEQSTDSSSGTDTKDLAAEKAKSSARARISREKIVYTGDATIETLDFVKSCEKLYEVIENAGGIIQSENQYDQNTDWYYRGYDSQRRLSLQIRIPSENFKSFCDGLSDIGNVTDKSTNAQNITSEYIDVEERLKSLQTEKKKMEELLEKASTLEETISLQDKITDLQYQIESSKSKLQSMDLDVAYSTMTIYVTEVSEYTTTPRSFFGKIGSAFKGSFRFFINFLQGLIILLIYAIPPVATIVLLVLLIRWCIKKIAKKFNIHRKPKAPKRQAWRQPPMPPVPPVYPPEWQQPQDGGEAPAPKEEKKENDKGGSET